MCEGNSNAAAERQQDVLKEKMRSADTDISEVCDYIVPDQRSSLNFILLFLFVWLGGFFLVFFTIENAGGMLVCSACQGCRSWRSCNCIFTEPLVIEGQCNEPLVPFSFFLFFLRKYTAGKLLIRSRLVFCGSYCFTMFLPHAVLSL